MLFTMLKKKKKKPTTLGNFFLLPKSKDVAHARQFLPLNDLFSKNKRKKISVWGMLKNLASCILLVKKHKLWKFMLVMEDKVLKIPVHTSNCVHYCTDTLTR